jgi:hypothetical protein
MRKEHAGRRAERDHSMRPIAGDVREIGNHDTNNRADSGTQRDLDRIHLFFAIAL